METTSIIKDYLSHAENGGEKNPINVKCTCKAVGTESRCRMLTAGPPSREQVELSWHPAATSLWQLAYCTEAHMPCFRPSEAISRPLWLVYISKVWRLTLVQSNENDILTQPLWCIDVHIFKFLFLPLRAQTRHTFCDLSMMLTPQTAGKRSLRHCCPLATSDKRQQHSHSPCSLIWLLVLAWSVACRGTDERTGSSTSTRASS